jgi:hypothetical protein
MDQVGIAPQAKKDDSLHGKDPFQMIPQDVTVEIFSLLFLDDVLRCLLVCKRFHRLGKLAADKRSGLDVVFVCDITGSVGYWKTLCPIMCR